MEIIEGAEAVPDFASPMHRFARSLSGEWKAINWRAQKYKNGYSARATLRVFCRKHGIQAEIVLRGNILHARLKPESGKA